MLLFPFMQSHPAAALLKPDQMVDHIGGILNLTGVRPGQAFNYEGPTMPNTVSYSVKFLTTYEAIEKVVLPPPLKADRDLPPEVTVVFFINHNAKALDGRRLQYKALFLIANTYWGLKKATSGWEYVDGLYGDKTEIDIMGPWGVYFGMLKKMADINILPITPDEVEVTMDRRGQRIMTMRLRVGQEMSKQEAEGLDNPEGPGMLMVREIPDANYTGFVDRAIYNTPTQTATVHRAWHADQPFVKFSSIEMDPLGDLTVSEMTGAICTVYSSPKPIFTDFKLVEQLPRQVA